MTDTQILDFIEKSIERRSEDARWAQDYMCFMGTIAFSLGPKQPKPFRELVQQAQLNEITNRLIGKPT